MGSILSGISSLASTAHRELDQASSAISSSLASLTGSSSAAGSSSAPTAASSSSVSSTAAATNAAIDATDSLGNENTFLQLLVAQIQNQDPTNPVDSSTFLSQLAEFSQLEQLIGIRQDVSELDPTATSSTTGTATSS